MQTRDSVFSYQEEKAFPLNPRGGYDNPYTPSPAHHSSLSQTFTHTLKKKEHNSREKPNHTKIRNGQTVVNEMNSERRFGPFQAQYPDHGRRFGTSVGTTMEKLCL